MTHRNYGTHAFTYFEGSDWAVSTNEVPEHLSFPSMWYGVPSVEHTVVRVHIRCKYCDVLQVHGKVKCPYCGAPYDEHLPG